MEVLLTIKSAQQTKSLTWRGSIFAAQNNKIDKLTESSGKTNKGFLYQAELMELLGEGIVALVSPAHLRARPEDI